MFRVKKKPLIFIVIEFANIPGLFDYPKHLPIPLVGEVVLLDGKSGIVEEVWHNTRNNVTEIKIICKQY